MPRKLYLLAFIVVGLHLLGVAVLGTSPAGSLLGNCLQITASGIAAVMAVKASRRASGMRRPFWFLFACGVATWGLADGGWTYYEIILHAEPPTGSAVRFLFDSQSIFFAMALFLDLDKDSTRLDPESILDFIQLAIIFLFVYLGLYYIPVQHLSQHDGLLREIWITMGGNIILIALLMVKSAFARSRNIQKLYVSLGLYLFVYVLGAGFADYRQSIKETPTGTWADLAWTLPLLFGAVWAARWQDLAATPPATRLRRKTVGEMVLTNATFALAPLIVLLQISQLPAQWQLLRFSLLGVSILCFGLRLGIIEYREGKTGETIRTHTLAMDSAIDGMAIVNTHGSIDYINPAYARVLGVAEPEEVVGQKWCNACAVEDADKVENEILVAVRTQGKWVGEISGKRRNGERFPLEMAVTGMPGGGMVCISRDITQRRNEEWARTKAEAKYRLFIEQVAAISYIAELGINGHWLYVSPQVETILGYSPEEWLANSRDWLRHIPEEDHPAVKAAENACSRGETFQAEYRIVRKDGKAIWVSDTAVVVRGSDLHPVMEGLIVDITERKQLENQLQRSHRMEAVGRLAGGIAHDFNNLLTIIKGYAELALNRTGIDPAFKVDVQQIGNAAERASTLVRQLLAFSRKQIIHPKSLDLNTIVMGLDKLLRRLMSEDIEMLTFCDENAGTVKADPGQIEQVIMNLVVNARDAMPNGGRLTIETTNIELNANPDREHATVQPGRYVMLAVSDTGVGMDTETQAHIFEPFFTTKSGTHGTGLGLSTVYGIVKQSGGYIWVYSELGKGTTFKIYLPRVDDKADAAGAAAEIRSVCKGTETILIVEDEEGVRELARTVLAAQGYGVIVADNPSHAEKLASEHCKEIRLVLTDVVMPGISGRELARKITARHPDTRVLYMSGYTDNVITQGGVLEPGVAFLQKPFSPRALAAKVREVLDSAVAANKNV